MLQKLLIQTTLVQRCCWKSLNLFSDKYKLKTNTGYFRTVFRTNPERLWTNQGSIRTNPGCYKQIQADLGEFQAVLVKVQAILGQIQAVLWQIQVV